MPISTWSCAQSRMRWPSWNRTVITPITQFPSFATFLQRSHANGISTGPCAQPAARLEPRPASGVDACCAPDMTNHSVIVEDLAPAADLAQVGVLGPRSSRRRAASCMRRRAHAATHVLRCPCWSRRRSTKRSRAQKLEAQAPAWLRPPRRLRASLRPRTS